MKIYNDGDGWRIDVDESCGRQKSEEDYYNELFIEHFSRGEEISMEALKERFPYKAAAGDAETKNIETIEISVHTHA